MSVQQAYYGNNYWNFIAVEHAGSNDKDVQEKLRGKLID
jgi:hypothetical protein